MISDITVNISQIMPALQAGMLSEISSRITNTISSLDTVSTWQVAVNIAQIVSAFGTVAAVVVALFLANRNQSQRLQFFSAVFGDTVVGPGPTDSYLEHSISLTIVNSGLLPAVIQSTEFHFDAPHHAWHWGFGPINGTGNFPMKLEHGQQVRCTFLFDATAVPWNQVNLKLITKRRMKFVVETSLGRKYVHRPHKMMLSAIKLHIQNARRV